MNFFWIISLVFASSVMVSTQTGRFPPTMKGKFCGQKLYDVLALICDGRGYNPMYKKSHIFALENEVQGDDYISEQQSEPRWPFLSRQEANSPLRSKEYHRRFRRGAYDECCQKSCTFQELESYCAKKPK